MLLPTPAGQCTNQKAMREGAPAVRAGLPCRTTSVWRQQTGNRPACLREEVHPQPDNGRQLHSGQGDPEYPHTRGLKRRGAIPAAASNTAAMSSRDHPQIRKLPGLPYRATPGCLLAGDRVACTRCETRLARYVTETVTRAHRACHRLAPVRFRPPTAGGVTRARRCLLRDSGLEPDHEREVTGRLG